MGKKRPSGPGSFGVGKPSLEQIYQPRLRWTIALLLSNLPPSNHKLSQTSRLRMATLTPDQIKVLEQTRQRLVHLTHSLGSLVGSLNQSDPLPSWYAPTPINCALCGKISNRSETGHHSSPKLASSRTTSSASPSNCPNTTISFPLSSHTLLLTTLVARSQVHSSNYCAQNSTRASKTGSLADAVLVLQPSRTKMG